MGCCTYATLKHGNVIRSSKIMSLWCCRCLAMAAEMPPDIGLCSPDPDSLGVTMQREKSLAGRIFFVFEQLIPKPYGCPIGGIQSHPKRIIFYDLVSSSRGDWISRERWKLMWTLSVTNLGVTGLPPKIHLGCGPLPGMPGTVA